MSNVQHNAALNELLIHLSRGFLQYIGECSPWSGDPTGNNEEQITQLVTRQREDIDALAELLDRRSWTIETGTYPTSNTDQHYLSLDYLLPQIVASEKNLLEISERDVNRLADDHEALPLLQQIHEHQLDSVQRLKSLKPSGQLAGEAK